MGLLLETCFPELSTAGTTPAKLTMELRRENRRTSPISAINWTAVASPTPYMARTVSYSGSCWASRVITVRRTASVGCFQQRENAFKTSVQLPEQKVRLGFHVPHRLPRRPGIGQEGLLAARGGPICTFPALK